MYNMRGTYARRFLTLATHVDRLSYVDKVSKKENNHESNDV
jgi:hypothetical protein